MKAIVLCCLLSLSLYSQKNLDKIIKGGELLVTGLTILKDKPNAATNGMIEKICVRNKLTDKITLNLSTTGADGTAVLKTMVIPTDGKECLLDLPVGVYTYEIVLPSKEIYKRGEYRFDAATTITVKPN